MATSWKYGSWSSVASYNNGKFKARVKYKVSNKAFTFGYDVKITNAFNKAQPFYIRYKKNGSWTAWVKSKSNHKSGDFARADFSLSEEVVEIQVAAGSGQAKKVTVPKVSRTLTAVIPTSITATQINDNNYLIKVSGAAYKTRSTDKLAVERQTNDGTWEAIQGSPFSLNATANYNVTYNDTATSRNHKYNWRVQAQNIVAGVTYNSGWRYTGEKFSSPATNVTLNIDSSEDSNVLSWSIDETGLTEINQGIVQGWNLYKSKNGGAYELLINIPAIISPTTYDYEYEDEEIEPGYSYSYQIKSYGGGGESLQDSKTETEVIAPPTRPSEVKVYRQTNDHVNITVLSNSINTATETQIERSIDGGDFELITTESFSPKLTYVDESAVAEDNIIYRALNKNESYISEYTESNMVMIKSKPNPPYLTKPLNLSNMNIATDAIRLEWMHQPTDGTPQQNAELQWRKNSGAWTTITSIGNNQYYDLSVSGFNSGDVIEWKVRTKGSYQYYSDYSDVSTFIIRSNPQIIITSPERDEVISELPIEIEFYYDGVAGNLKELHIDIIKDNKVDKTITVDIETGIGGTYNVALNDYLFESETVYGLQVYALAESGLSSNEIVSIQVQYDNVELDGGYLLSTDIDEDTGIVNVQVDRDVTSDDEDEPPTPINITRALLYRVHERERVFLAEVSEGDSFYDALAPLNCNYMYELQMLTASGQVSIVQLEVEQDSIYSYIYYDDDIFKAKWNPVIDVSLGRPERKEQRYSGRMYAVSYDSKARDETCKYSTTLTDRDELVQLKELMRAGNGHGIWKSLDGDSYYANFEMTYKTNKYYSNQEWEVSLSVTRIEGKNGL